MKHLTVRLNDEDAARVAELRERGVKISSLVREAIGARCKPRVPRMQKPGDVDKVLQEIYSKCPDKPGTPAPTLDLTDRKAVAAAFRVRILRSKSN
jgi:hypothetical protein